MPRASAATLPPSACPASSVVEGTAPAALRGLPPPDAIFVGGGASDAGVLDRVIDALHPGGRLVVNAVTLETEALLIARHARARRRAHPHRHHAGKPHIRPDNVGHDGVAPCYAGDAVGVGEAMIVAGIGCRRGAPADAIMAAIAAALARSGLGKEALHSIATSAIKGEEPGIADAAAAPRRAAGSGCAGRSRSRRSPHRHQLRARRWH